MSLKIIIARDQLPWYKRIFYSQHIFTSKDIDIKGPLLLLFKKTIIDVFTDQFNCQEGYEIKEIKCTFKESEVNDKNDTNFQFEMRLLELKDKPFPKHHSDATLPETVELADNMRVKMKIAILNE